MSAYLVATLLFAAMFFRGCDSKVVVVPVPPDKAMPAEGVIYALPNTVARLQVKVDKTVRSGARFAPYAAIFAPDGDPVCKEEKCAEENEKTYSLQQGTTFATYGEPDPTNVFLVKFTGKRTVDQSLSMTWNEVGLISAASASVTNRTGDVILSGLKLAAGLGTKAAFGAALANEAKANVDVKRKCQKDPSATNTDEWVIETIWQNATSPSDATLIGNYCAIKKEDRDNPAKFPPQNTPLGSGEKVVDPVTKVETDYTYGDLLKDAVKAYMTNVAPLIATRQTILTGGSLSSEPATLLSHIETEINQQLTILYLGMKRTLTWEGALDVRSLAEGVPLAVLRIDPKYGICLGNSEVSPDSKPIPGDKFNILPAGQCAAAAPVNLTLDFYPVRSKQLFTKITDITTGERSFRYRIPAQVRARLEDSNKVYGSGVFSVAQLGTVISLPANRHSKTLSYDLAFIESTGGLKTFKLGTTGGLDTATVDALSGIGGTLIDASKKNDEVNRLTRQQQLLKLQDDICTIQKKYGLPCTVQPQ